MKQSDAFRMIANAVDMCEGTGVSFSECILDKKTKMLLSTTNNILGWMVKGDVDIAVAIIQGKPAFNGDTYYNYGSKQVVSVLSPHWSNPSWKEATWEEAPTMSDVELAALNNFIKYFKEIEGRNPTKKELVSTINELIGESK